MLIMSFLPFINKDPVSLVAHDALQDSRTCGKIINIAAKDTQQTDLIQLLNSSKVELCWL